MHSRSTILKKLRILPNYWACRAVLGVIEMNNLGYGNYTFIKYCSYQPSDILKALKSLQKARIIYQYKREWFLHEDFGL